MEEALPEDLENFIAAWEIARSGSAPGGRFAIVPQVLPLFLSQALYYFESNVRSATVIGMVGAGGIGLYLANEIGQQSWDHVSFIILMILITVAIIDALSARLRRSIIGVQARS